MPFVSITTRCGRPKTELRAISDAIHTALREAFHVPEDDLFHVINEVGKTNIVFPQSYLGIPHSNETTFVQITAGIGRTSEQKRVLYRTIAEQIASNTTISENDVVVCLVESPVENWSFGKGEAPYIGSPRPEHLVEKEEDFPSLSDDRFKRGLELLDRIDGEAGHKVIESLSDIAPDLANYIIEYPFGDIYNRPGLGLKLREIATVAALTALGNAAPQLRVHLHAALNVGCSKEELIETIMQMSVYAGFPAALNAIFIAKEVFAEHGTSHAI